MQTLLQDLRYGWRTLRKTPSFTLIAILALALGIGATTAIFSVVDAVMLRPLPFRDASRLMMVFEKPPGGDHNSVSAATFLDWKDQNHCFESTAAATWKSFILTGVDEPEEIRGSQVSASLFPLLGMNAAIGRTFSPEEDKPGANQVVLLSYGLWQRRFGGDRGIVGRAITLNGSKYTVVGIMPAGFRILTSAFEIWTPAAFDRNQVNREFHYLMVLARLKPDVTLARARAEMNTIGQRIAKDFPKTNENWGVQVEPFREWMQRGNLRETLFVLLGAVGLVLLIACVNVANLLLARATARQKEIAIRASLGAGRWRLVRQLLTESVLLASIGGLLGVLLAAGLIHAAPAVIPRDALPAEAKTILLDNRVLFFALGLSILTGLIFGLAPAVQASSADLNETLKEGGRGSGASIGQRFRRALVVAEVALALVLLTGAGLLMQSLLQLQRVNPGFRADNVLTMGLPLSKTKYQTPSQIMGFYREALARIEALPGVRSAAICNVLPLQGWGFGMPFDIAERPPHQERWISAAHFQFVSYRYFETMGISLLKGRAFTEHDAENAAPAAIINETMARREFPNEDPIGKHLKIQALVPGKQELGPIINWQIVGVIKNVKVTWMGDDRTEEVYVPLPQSPWPGVDLAIHSAGAPIGLAAAVRREIQAIDPDQPITEIRSMQDVMKESVAEPRFRTILIGTFASLALLLAAIGIYGVMSYMAAQRTHEVGIRMALGAQARDVLVLMLGQGLLLTVVGVGLGLGAALALTRVLSTLLFHVGARDPGVFAAVSLLLACVALAACLLPARRATKVDPLAALRYE